MAAHRVQPQMMGIIPQNTGGFGDDEKASVPLSSTTDITAEITARIE